MLEATREQQHGRQHCASASLMTSGVSKLNYIFIACYINLPEIPPTMDSYDTLIRSTLNDIFGFDTFREGQEEVIVKILGGQSALAVFPTGSGKSLCYQLSALLLDGLTLVISPLIALMKDQIDFLHERNIPAARLDSTLELSEIRRIDADLQADRLKLLYVAPERFSNERFIQKLGKLKIALMVIDEAHCISEWGHNFRPDYLKLARTARALGIQRVLTLTATATPAVAGDICRQFGIAPDAFIHTGFYRPNLRLLVAPCQANEQIELLLARLKDRPPGSTIVYVTLQRTAETVATRLSQKGFPARAYHAGLPNEERNTVQNWFMESSEAIVVATIAFGMGIDKSDIRYVYHYNLPKSLESYSQEIGRAGRDGKDSICEILARGSDVIVLENFTYGDTPDPESVSGIVDAILRHDGEFDLSLYELSRDYDTRPLVVGTLLTYLELADVIESTEPFYNEYQFTLLKPSHQILSKFDAVRTEFLEGIFSNATKGVKWFTVDLNATIHRLGTTRSRVIKALNYLEEQGDLVLKVAGLRQGYRIKTRPADVSALKRKLIQRFETRERNDVNRVRQVVQLAEEPGCIVRHLVRHFGEDLGRDCGHCSSCAGDSSRVIGIPEATTPGKVEAGKIAALQKANPKALRSARQVARFLCGLSSPLVTQAKLSKHPEFGSLAEIPFHIVMKAAETAMPLGTTRRPGL
jgi:ATP-dependent DNA helicase RecQ